MAPPVMHFPKNFYKQPHIITHMLGSCFLSICSVPLFRLCYLIQNIGGNNLANDYIRLVPIVDQVLLGKYDWLKLASDAYTDIHFELIPILCHLICAKFFEWGARSELFLGIIFALIRVLLLCSLFRANSLGKLNYFLCGIVLALSFSISQASVFFYGETSLPIELCLLGYTLGLFAIVRIERPWFRKALIIFSGVLSSFSWGNFLPCWITFFVALILFRRPKSDYIFSFLGAAISIIPYLHVMCLIPWNQSMAIDIFRTWNLFVNIIGRPFCNNIGQNFGPMETSFVAGLLSLTLYAFSLTILISNKCNNSNIKVGIILGLYGLFSALIISVVRVFIAPWYTAISISFWIALLILTDALFSFQSSNKSSTNTRFNFLNLKLLGIVNLIIITTLYCRTNISYEDKDCLLPTRTPASESILRNYRTAPTYCEWLLFVWGGGHSLFLQTLAQPLEKHSLSAFGSNQQWSLQGDFPLHNVTLTKKSNDNFQSYWVESTALKDKNLWYSFKHLNLCLAVQDRICWTVVIPTNAKSAVFVTAVTTPDEFTNICPDLINCKITFSTRNKSKQIYVSMLSRESIKTDKGWQVINVPLNDFKGQELTITISTTDHTSQNMYVLFQYPHIDVNLEKKKQIFTTPRIEPSNTDLSPYMVKNTTNDYCLSYNKPNLWHEGRGTGEEVLGDGVGRRFIKTHYDDLWSWDNLNISLTNYSHFKVTMKTDMGLDKRRSLDVDFYLKGNAPKSFYIPLLADNSWHTYTYDFKLLNLDPNTILDKIYMSPASFLHSSNCIQVKDIRLISEH